MSSTTDTRDRIVSYVTDVEGDGAYLDRFVERSTVLTHEPTEPRVMPSDGVFFPYEHRLAFTDDRAHLVHGGDVWDKGGNDLYVIRQLLDLKERHPDRVHLIMGNRDINKLRILQELGLFDPLPPHRGVYWLKGTGRPGDPDLDDKSVPNDSAVDRLIWMLTQTMGCPDSFDLRRQELMNERHFVGAGSRIDTDSRSLSSSSSTEEVTPEDVVQSYRWSCHPLVGEMGQYLSQAKIALRMGDVLFTHGCLPLTTDVLSAARQFQSSSLSPPGSFWDDFSFAMPWLQHQRNNLDQHKDGGSSFSSPETTVDNANDWIDALNKFAAEDIQAWAENAVAADVVGYVPEGAWATVGTFGYWPSRKSSSYGRLLQYVMRRMPSMHPTPTVVSNTWMKNGMPRQFFPTVQDKDDRMFASLTGEFFDVADLRLIVTGHKPVGDMPTPIRVNNDKWVISCDTSYSGDVLWLDENGREVSKPGTGRGSATSARGDVAVR